MKIVVKTSIFDIFHRTVCIRQLPLSGNEWDVVERANNWLQHPNLYGRKAAKY